MNAPTFLAAQPKPLHGMSTVNRLMLGRLKKNNTVRSFNLVPSFLSSLYPGKAWMLVRTLYLLLLLPFFTLHSLFTRSGPLYFSISGGAGQWLELPFMFVAGLCYKRIYVHHHSFAYCNRYQASMHWLQKLGRGKLSHIVLCDNMQQHLNRHYTIPAEDIRVLSNLAFFTATDYDRRDRDKPHCIGFLGNITYDKGIVEFLDTCQLMHKSTPDMRFVIAGPCADKGIRHLIEKACKELPTLEYRGPVYQDAKRAFFRDIDVLLFPTSYVNEAQPLTIYEAFAAGVPVIAWARGCIAGMIDNGAGLAIPVECPFTETATTTLQTWLTNPADFSAMANNLPERLQQRQNDALHVLDDLQAELTRES